MVQLGIIGGMGPLAGINLHESIVKGSMVNGDNDHLPIIHVSLPVIGSRIDALLSGKYENVVDPIVTLIEKLYHIGCTDILMACNTVHLFKNDILAKLQENVKSNINILDIINITFSYIKSHLSSDNLLITGRKLTLEQGLFNTYAHAFGFNTSIGTEDSRQAVDEIIIDIKKDPARISEHEQQFFDIIISLLPEFQQQNDQYPGIVLGCTELSLFDRRKLEGSNFHVYDVASTTAMKIASILQYPDWGKFRSIQEYIDNI